MAIPTFGDVVRRVRLHAPIAPLFLARSWVQEAWQDLCTKRGFSFLRSQITLAINTYPVRAPVVNVTLGSPVLTSAALFLSTDVGRQFRAPGVNFTNADGSPSGGGQTYTILSFQSTSQVTLDRPYGDTQTQSNVAAQILDAYFVCPVDFAYFTLIPDLYTQRRLAFWITQDQLNILDPKRLNSDFGPRCLSAIAPSQVPATLGQMMSEYWPYPISQRSYPAVYMRLAPTLQDTDIFSGALATGGVEKLIDGALSRCARWPGLTDQKNPYFNLALADDLEKRWAQSMQSMSLADDNILGEDYATVNWGKWPLMDLAFNDRSLRATDATVSDFY